uniref:Uncharacterized protein n=1 Tax=Toxoplasma gondii TgCATBr9 TaxID=943120 RepID=A0A2T6IX36_TOXGO|nr:hypothetical protein TGBR9_381720 [Toxoplasma gondii TgCATBr9]
MTRVQNSGLMCGLRLSLGNREGESLESSECRRLHSSPHPRNRLSTPSAIEERGSATFQQQIQPFSEPQTKPVPSFLKKGRTIKTMPKTERKRLTDDKREQRRNRAMRKPRRKDEEIDVPRRERRQRGEKKERREKETEN